MLGDEPGLCQSCSPPYPGTYRSGLDKFSETLTSVLKPSEASLGIDLSEGPRAHARSDPLSQGKAVFWEEENWDSHLLTYAGNVVLRKG